MNSPSSARGGPAFGPTLVVIFCLLLFGALLSRRGGGQQDNALSTWLETFEQREAAGTRGSLLTSTATQKLPRFGGDGLARGQVTDRDGHPLAGAQVCAYQEGGALWGPAQAPLCDRTDATGAYALGLYSPAIYLVHASARGHLPGPAVGARPKDMVRIAKGGSVDLDFALASGGVTLAGRVEDLYGGVVEGAWISTHPLDLRMIWGTGLASALSAADGSFELWVGPGEANLRAGAAGYGETQRWTGAPASALSIVLMAESKISGTVVDGETGQPVEGAWVASGGYGASNIGFGGETTRSDADGHFTLLGLMPGRYRPVARAPGRYGEASSFVGVVSGDVGDVLITVEPAGDLSVQTVFSDNQAPCVGATMTLADVQYSTPMTAKSDTDGMSVFLGVATGTYRLSVECLGARPRNEAALVKIDAESNDSILVELERGRSIRGTVVDGQGAPLAGVMVSAGSRGPSGPEGEWSGGQSAPTDSDGAFEVLGLVAGEYGLDAYGSSVTPSALSTVVVQLEAARDLDDVRLVVERGSAVRGRVLTRSGSAASGLLVQASSGGPENVIGGAVTDEDGYFFLTGLRMGAVRVEVLTMEQESKRSQLRFSRMEQQPGGIVEGLFGNPLAALPQLLGTGNTAMSYEELDAAVPPLATLELDLSAAIQDANVDKVYEIVVDVEQLEIRGCVLDHDGSPLSGAFVNWYPTGSWDSSVEQEPVFLDSSTPWQSGQRPVISGDDGCFVIPGLARGAYNVMVGVGFGPTIAKNGVSAGSTIELSLPAMGDIEGNVATAVGSTALVFVVTLTDEQHGYWRTEEFRAVGGSWSLQDVPAGEYSLSIEGVGGGTQVSARVRSGQTTRVDAKLPAPASLRGRVLDPDGVGAANAIVSVNTEGLRSRFAMAVPTRTDASGRFVVEQVAAGKVYLSAVSEGGPEGASDYGGPIEVTVRGGEMGNAPDLILTQAWAGGVDPSLVSLSLDSPVFLGPTVDEPALSGQQDAGEEVPPDGTSEDDVVEREGDPEANESDDTGGDEVSEDNDGDEDNADDGSSEPDGDAERSTTG